MQIALVNKQPTPTEEKGSALFLLIEAYNQQKAILDAAKAKFAAIEEELIEEIGYKPEGSFTAHIDGFKITTTGRMSRRIDEKKWAELAEYIPAPLANRLIKTKLDINLRELRYIEQNEPELYKVVASAVTTRPGKPSIKVEAEA